MEEEIQELKRRLSELENKQELSYRQFLRLKNALQGSNTYYVATGATGAVNTPLKFVDGILHDDD